MNKPDPTLAELLNTVPISPYSVDSESDYKSFLSKISLLELQEHSAKLGIKPSYDRSSMERNLTNEFRRKNASLMAFSSEIKKTEEIPTIESFLREKMAEIHPNHSYNKNPETFEGILRGY